MQHFRAINTWVGLSLALMLSAGCAWRGRKSPTGLAPTSSRAEDLGKNGARRVEAQARYASGLAHELRREPDKALEEFILSVRADPSNEELALDVSRQLVLAKDLTRALELAELAAKEKGASAMVFAQLAVLYAEAGRPKDAEHANRKAITLAPENLVGYYNLYMLHLGQGRTEQARAVLDEAVARKSAAADYWLDLAELYANFIRTKPAEKDKALPALKQCLKRAAEAGVDGPARRQKLADGFASAGELTRAVPIYLQLLEQMPAESRMRDVIRQKLLALYITGQDADGALVQLEAIVRDHPTNPQANFLLASVAYEKKDFPRAKEYFGKTLQLAPDFEQAYYSLTAVLLDHNEDKEAARLLATTREKFPRSFVAEYYSAVVHGRLDEPTTSLTHYRIAEAIAKATMPNRLDHVFFFQMGAQQERAKLYEDAAATFKRSLELKGDFAPALNYLGYMWADQGTNLTEARGLIQRAVDLEPESAAYLDSLAWVLFKLDQPNLALTYIEQALSLQKEPDATLFDHLGDIQRATGNLEQARAAWRQSLQIAADPVVQKKLEALNSTEQKSPP